MQNSFSGGRSNIRNSDRKRSNKSHTFNICPQLPGHHTNHLSTQEIKSSQQNQSCIAMSVKRKSHYDLSIILDLFSDVFFSLSRELTHFSVFMICPNITHCGDQSALLSNNCRNQHHHNVYPSLLSWSL